MVTGAGRGIGRGIALELAGKGFSVAVNYRSNTAAAEETVELCRRRAGRGKQNFIPLRGDVADREQREELVKHCIDNFGRIDALVNNAGVAPVERRDILDMTEESFERLMRINLQGPFFLTREVVRYWRNKKIEPLIPGGFKLVFIGSISADVVSLNRGEYCISKAGLAMASRLWAQRLAGEGIQVYELRPGIIETDMTGGVKEKYDTLIAEGLVPQRRWGAPEDIGRAVRAILEGDFAFSTGSVLYIDGGLHIKEL